MIPTNVVPFPEIQSNTHFGSCPLCGNSDGYVNLGKEHWFICRDHKFKWFAGVNMFEGWENQTVAQAECIENMLRAYQEVVPLRNIDEEHKLGVNVI